MAGMTACTGAVGGGTSSGSAGNGGPGTAGSNTGPGSAGNTGPGTAGNTGPGSGGATYRHGGHRRHRLCPSIPCVPGIPATTQLRRMQNWQYDATVRDLLGVTTVDVGAGAQAPSTQLYADFDGPMVPDACRIYKNVGAAIAKAVMANATQKAKFITCDPAATGTAGTTCLTNTIKTFGRKAFRRPLADAEVTRFLALGRDTTPAPTGAEYAEAILYAFLVSPSFIALPETDTTTPSGSGFQLSQYEVAQRLSYMLWGSIPDDMLNTAADGNQLQTKAQILAQAQRMMAVRDKTTPLVQLFHRQWVQMNNATRTGGTATTT